MRQVNRTKGCVSENCLTDGTVAASTCTPEELSRALTTFSLPEYAPRCSGVSSDSVASSEAIAWLGLAGSSDFRPAGTWVKSSRTVSERKSRGCKNM